MVEGEQGLLLRRTWGAGQGAQREQRRSRRRNVECCYILLQVEVATDNRFLTAQLITSLWLLIFRQFKASSPEFGDADIWYCLYSYTAR